MVLVSFALQNELVIYRVIMIDGWYSDALVDLIVCAVSSTAKAKSNSSSRTFKSP